MLDSTTMQEIEDETAILCEDLRMMAMVTDQLFNVPQSFRCNPCECGGICPNCNPDEYEYLRTEMKREATDEQIDRSFDAYR